MRIQVDRTRCAGIGLCESFCPDVFEVGDDGVLVLIQGEVVPEGVVHEVRSAITSCPTGALSTPE